MQKQNEEAYTKWDTEALVQCKACGRTFLPDRLEIHKRSCTQDRPLKARFGEQRPNCLIGGNGPGHAGGTHYQERTSVSPPTKTQLRAQ